jgi:ribosomal protein S18 acetylase RimI-like enzyme
MAEERQQLPASATQFERAIIRPGVASDEPVVGEILRQANLSFHASSQDRSPAPPPFGEVSMDLCELDGRIVAVLQWRHLGQEAEILDLAVPVALRRKGYARFLLENFLRTARARGTQRFFLEVRESNAAAISLYRQFGFVPFGRRPDYYRSPPEAALLLRLKFTT